jgi:threonine/homoserine/homoserine lactone efflux protein
VHPGQGSETAQILILGAFFWIIGAIWDRAFACASGTIGTWLARRPRIQAVQPRLEGLAYFGLAGWAAITGSRSGR